MINFERIYKNLFKRYKTEIHRSLESDWFDGVLIFHTKKNPHRKSSLGLTTRSINNRDRHLKYRWPVRFFLQETLPDFYRRTILCRLRRILDLKYEFLCRFVKSYQTHIIYPRFLKPGYNTRTDQMLHSSFEIFCEYYENEFENIDWYDSHYNSSAIGIKPSDAADAMKFLYQWWTVDRLNRKYPEYDGEISDFIFQDDDKYKEYKEWRDTKRIMYEQHDIEDEAMLLKLMSIRSFLDD